MKMMGRPKNEYRFFDPKGNLVIAKGLKELCETNDLNMSRMSSVHRGKVKHHKGWTTARSADEITCDHECIIRIPSNIELWIRHTARVRGVSESEVIHEAFSDARIKERKRKAALD